MRLNKKITEGIVLMIFALVLVGSGICSEIAKEPVGKTVEQTEDIAVAENAKAGIIASIESEESRMMDSMLEEKATLEKTITPVLVTAAKSEEKELSKTELEWQDKVMADVDSFLAIRKKGSVDAELLGKMYPTSVATVVKEGKEWTKIKSGKVTGYVRNSYLLYGMDAYKQAKKLCKKYAFVETDGLRVRAEADEEAKVLATADKGDKLLFDADAKKEDGWVAVEVKAGSGYVSSKYVTVELNTTTAKTIEEELEEQKKKLEASGSAKHDPMDVSDEEFTLLAAIIWCEAGCEPYEGQVAVGAVVLNRVRSSGFPNTIEGVIYQRGQFGPARNGSLSRTLSDTSRISDSCYRAAKEALAGADPTNGKKYFHTVDGTRGQIIGSHVFL